MKKILCLLAVFSGATILNASRVSANGFPQYTRTDYSLTGGSAKFIHIGSGNTDIYPDVIVLGWTGVLYVFPGGPEGVLGVPVITETGINEPKMTAVDDFNNDGLSDIFIHDTLFMATGEGLFAPPKSLGIENLQTIASADMNGDGNKDLIAISIIYTSPTMRTAEIQTHFGNGDGTFQAPVKTRIVFDNGEFNWVPPETVLDDSGIYSIPYIGDLTGDGIPDLVVSHYYVTDDFITHLNRTYTGSSNGTFTKNLIFSPYGLNTQNIVVHDFTGDGIVDILCPSPFSLYAGDNTGNFTYLWGKYESRVFTSVDVNGDGILDAAIIRDRSTVNEEYCKLAAMLGNSDGTYGDIYEFPIVLPFNYLGYGYPEYPGLGSIMACNLNNDGCADFIISNWVIPYDDQSFFSVILSHPGTSHINEKNEIFTPVLYQNIPNPFNASTTIPYSIQEPGIYELTVYDILGRKIATLVDGPMSAGKHSVNFDGSKLASGVYLYRFESGGLNRTGKMLLLK
jgi:hypothetical protein